MLPEGHRNRQLYQKIIIVLLIYKRYLTNILKIIEKSQTVSMVCQYKLSLFITFFDS